MTLLDEWLLQAPEDDLTRHGWRVAEIAGILATHLGLSGEMIARTTRAGVLHDVGKRGLPTTILDKPAPLGPDEWLVMMTHPARGYAMVMDKVHPDIAEAVRTHHERYDGCGYPRGLAGEEIPLSARVLLVADAFDAMTSDRPYQGPLSTREALAELRAHAGSQFDPGVVAAMLDLTSRVHLLAA